MFTHKDIQYRTIFVINCIQERNLRVYNGELLLEKRDNASDKRKTLTKIPFLQIFALFIVGHITITTPLIEKCQKFGVALVVMKPNLRPIFYWSNSAEANFLLRQQQYCMSPSDISIAKVIISNKILNQIQCLRDTRRKDIITLKAIEKCNQMKAVIDGCADYNELMGIEGIASKLFFAAYFQSMAWQARRPRTKCDVINATLDIGYTILFNYIECFLRIYGFDVYVGIFHRLWFKRKSLVCDIMEPFRCIIDKAVRAAFNRKQFQIGDFDFRKGEYVLKVERSSDYYRVFFDALISYKSEVFRYVQTYYRCFMQRKQITNYPQFFI